MDTIAIGTATNSGKIHLGTNLFNPIKQHLMCKLNSRQEMTEIIGTSDAEGVEGVVALLLKHEVMPSRLCRSCFPARTMGAYQTAIRAAIEQEKAAEETTDPQEPETTETSSLAAEDFRPGWRYWSVRPGYESAWTIASVRIFEAEHQVQRDGKIFTPTLVEHTRRDGTTHLLELGEKVAIQGPWKTEA